MSTGEETHTATLSDFTTDTTQESRTASTEDWQPDDDRTCRNCGSHVTKQYARTMGDQNNEVYECPDCPGSSNRRRYAGATAGLDIEVRQFDGVSMQ